MKTLFVKRAVLQKSRNPISLAISVSIATDNIDRVDEIVRTNRTVNGPKKNLLMERYRKFHLAVLVKSSENTSSAVQFGQTGATIVGR